MPERDLKNLNRSKSTKNALQKEVAFEMDNIGSTRGGKIDSGRGSSNNDSMTFGKWKRHYQNIESYNQT